ncbi:MAG TPA: hypothetical protein VMZ29_06580 [Candidatus Bathyarchaeia archaeon]|nr:hypothetical protein [Candidatus Bathyarchaeia archaeon]
MDYSNLITKLAVDSSNVKLGKIIKVEKLLGKTVKKEELYLIIRFKKFTQKAVYVPIGVNLISEVNDFVKIDLSYNDFMEEVKRIKLINMDRNTSKEYIRFREKWFGPGHFMLAPRDRDNSRKK